MTRFTTSLTIACLLLISVTANAAVSFDLSGQGQVVHVMDGDTFVVRADNPKDVLRLQKQSIAKQKRGHRDLHPTDRFRTGPGTFVIRVANINTPESVHPDASRNTAAGRRASAYVKKLLHNRRLNYRCWDIGYYGRAICSVWTQKWELGSLLISQGYTQYITRFGRHPFLDDRYRQAESVAARRGTTPGND